MFRLMRRSPLAGFARVVVASLALVLALLGCGEHAVEGGTWHCPMHPTYTSDRPGDCPICGMKLVPVEEEEHAIAVEGGSGIGPVQGLATVKASAGGIRLAGVRTAVAERERLARATRTVGSVVADERLVRHVHTKVSGWVERLHANFTGQQVRRGQPILAIYSPELLASQEEYLRARQAAARFAASTLPEVRRGGEDLAASARRRLELFDVPASFLAALERTGQAQRAVTLVAPVSGFLSAKQVFEGMEVRPGMELFTLTDLSRVWVEAEFYENEARLLRVGQRAEVRLPYDPGHVLDGAVTFIDPTLSVESRTLKVRLELANPDGHLKPGMFVDVTADLEAAEGIAVPEDAVIDTGLRQVVFVEVEPGTFEPREVQVGLRGSGRAVLSSGVREGERVATRANFLLDSESKLSAALQAAKAPEASAGAAPSAAADAGHRH